MKLDESGIKTNRILLLFILLLDIVGFSLIFPIVPELLEHYIKQADAHALDGWLPPLIPMLEGMLPTGKPGDGRLIVLMGGLLGSVYSVLQFFTAPWWGRLSDRYGRRPILILTSGGLAISYLVWFLAPSFTLFIISRLLGGLMAGNLGVATAAMADMSPPSERTRAMGMVGAVFGIGFILGPAAGGLTAQVDLRTMVPALDFVNPFAFTALLASIVAGGGAFLNYMRFRETLPPAGRQHAWISNPLSALKSSNVQGSTETRPGDFIRVLLTYGIFIFVFAGFEFTITFFLKLEFKYTPLEIGLVFVYIGGLIALGQGGIVRQLTPRMGEKTIAVIGVAIMAVPLYLISRTAPSTGLFLAALLPLALGSALVQPALTGLASLMSPAEHQGYSLGVFRSAGSLARALGPVVGAYLYWMLGVQTAYLILAIMMAATALLAMSLKNVRRMK